jgi:hypothetical protein
MKTLMHKFVAALAAPGLAFVLLLACQPDDHLLTPAEPSPASIQDNARIPDIKVLVKNIIIYAWFRHQIQDPSNPLFCIPAEGQNCLQTVKIYGLDPPVPLKLNNPAPPCITCPPEGPEQIADDNIPDFRTLVQVAAELNWNEHVISFPLTRNAIGLQFYAENQILTRQGLTLRNDIPLSAEEQENLEVTGKFISNGYYRVIYNAQNNTYTAIVKVR